MSKTDDFLKALKDHCNQWVCSLHNTGKSNQPAAIFREIKRQGYLFEKVGPNRWAKNMYCEQCQQDTSHYKLLSKDPIYQPHSRCPIDKKSRERVLKLLDGKDAFTGASITSTPEIDHKIPWTRLDYDIDIKECSDEEIVENFQLLTREHNLLKDRVCTKCRIDGIRQPLFGINYWYEGDEKYRGTCEGCGWYDGAKWKECLNNELKKKLWNNQNLCH